MALWYWINSEILNDYVVHAMPPREYRRQMLAAMRGEQNYISQFVKIDRQSGRQSAEVWMETRRRIFARDDYTCQYCGERGKRLECDHVYPVSRGGGNEDENLKTACRPCNRNKRDKTLGEWINGTP